MHYCLNSVSTCAANTNLATGMAVTDLQTVENAVMVVVDTDGLGTVTAGDLVLVYASNNGDVTPAEISGTGYTLEFTLGGSTLCSSGLT
jgi:hypothetical protein